MADRPCPVCGQPIIDVGYVCLSCGISLTKALQRIAELWPETEMTLTRQVRNGDPIGGGEAPLMFAYDASEVRWVVTNTLTTWARHVSETRGRTIPHHPERSTVVVAAAYLISEVPWIRHQEEAEALLGEVLACRGWCERVVFGYGPTRFVGPCDVCGRDMYARPGMPKVECRPCDLEYDVAARREWLLDMAEDRLERASDIVRALCGLQHQVTRQDVKNWDARGRIVPRGRDQLGRPLYRVGDVLSLVLEREDKTGNARSSAS